MYRVSVPVWQSTLQRKQPGFEPITARHLPHPVQQCRYAALRLAFSRLEMFMDQGGCVAAIDRKAVVAWWGKWVGWVKLSCAGMVSYLLGIRVVRPVGKRVDWTRRRTRNVPSTHFFCMLQRDAWLSGNFRRGLSWNVSGGCVYKWWIDYAAIIQIVVLCSFSPILQREVQYEVGTVHYTLHSLLHLHPHLHCQTAPSPSYPFLISRGCFAFFHHRSSLVWYAPSSAIVNRILHQVHNFNVGVATAELWHSRSGFETVVRIERRLVTGFEIGLVVGPIVQFDCSARYHLVSSERERKEGNSDASKKGRIM